MVKEELVAALKKVLEELGVADVELTLEHPSDEKHGDYSSNIALKLKTTAQKSKLEKSPLALAEEIVHSLENNKQLLKVVEKIEVAKPGFINFWILKEYLISELGEVFKTTLRPKKEKIMLEFADPNPFKEFHIGHLRNISLGESFARLLESQGAQVWRVNYQGDVGMHVAKALYGIMQYEAEVMDNKELSVSEKVKVLGKAYSAGDKAYQEDESAKKEIQTLNLKVYRNDLSVKHLWEIGRKWSLEYFEQIYKRVRTKYRRYYFESEVAGPGREIVLEHVKDGTFEKHDGAVVFRGEKEGLHTRVFVTKEDYATYEAKDMALAGIKYKDFPYDRSIIITGHEQAPYFKVVLAAMRQVFPELASKTVHLSFGFVRLKYTKMSSRLGNVITGQWLLDEAKARIKKQFAEMDEETAEKVAVGAVKYSMLKFATASDISFSFEESISLEGNSGPYLQYTYARTQSVARKSQIGSRLEARSQQLEVEEMLLLRTIHRFPETVEQTAQGFAPNLLCNYLYDLAAKFNLFYQRHPIITGGEKKKFRLALTTAVGQTLKTGLYLLGIEAPERM